VIAVEGLEKRYGSHVALDGVDFMVPEGEIFGFLGPNGAGKTTTIRILATLASADGGSATVGGIRLDSEPYVARQLIGYMPDFFGVYDRLTAREYLDFYASCYDLPARRRRTAARDLLELVDLADRADAHVDVLSRGMKQRLGLARALVHDPRVLLLDEPASGLDPSARIEMRELIRELRRMGKTILISSHILTEVEDLCTWIGIIDRGRMVEAGPKAEVLRRVMAGRRIRIRLGDGADADAARPRLGARSGVMSVEVVDGALEVTVEDGFADNRLLRDLVSEGVDVWSFAPVERGLADAFMRLTAREE
jgi:ABC-2 type transport system ATP-binding protein